ncbi:MAG: succinate dehydrogenase, cytochrome b556 subunit [Gammaproteobacteria bacterium]
MNNGMHNRPKYLNLAKIRLPLPGVLSILHRVSGMVLIFALPFALAALQWSVGDAAGYAQVSALFGDGGYFLLKLAAFGAAWALFHHLCAGARFLLLDFHVGISLPAARFSAAAAFVVSIMMTIAFGVWLW